MRRRLFTFFSAVSLLLCLAAAGLGVRTYWEGYALHYASGPAGATLLTWAYVARGSVWIGRMEPTTYRPGWDYQRVPDPPAVSYSEDVLPGVKLGLGYIRRSTPGAMYGVAVPLWLASVAAAALPAWWVAQALRRQRRRRAGQCPDCGYDLRATPERCPECGAAAVQ